MLTIHRPSLGVRRTVGGPVEPGCAVLVATPHVVAAGPYEELLSADHARLSRAEGDDPAGAAGWTPEVRVREWDGLLEPGRHEPDGPALLERAYWPDPREADELGAEPLTGEAFAALPMTPTRLRQSARRGVQRLLARGTVMVEGPFTDPAIATIVQRSGMGVTRLGDRAAELLPRLLEVAPVRNADFVLRAADGTCLATVLAGRLVFRRR
ncbi:hypothetical protein [Streptomyces sp. CO7]